ncbi:MAG: hypothetical protein RLY87_1578 [Chloroflexota bacterium]
MNRTGTLTDRLRRALLHVMLLLGLFSALLPAGTTAQAATAQGRFVVAAQPKARTVTTSDDFFYGQLTTERGRTIVLNWAASAARMGSYDVYKSVGTSSATMIGTTSFVANASALNGAFVTAPRQLLAIRQAFNTTGLYTDTVTVSELYDQLASVNTILDKPTKTITETTFVNKARFAIQRFPLLAGAVGLSYRDTDTANPRATLTYTIRISNTMTSVGTIVVAPDGTTTNIPTPTGLREAGVYDGPSDLGIIGTSRPITAPERYDSGLVQNEINNDGTVYLTWTKGSISNGRMVAGYNVYRMAPTTLFWSKLNSELVSVNEYQPVSPPNITIPGPTPISVAAYKDDPYFYADTLITSPAHYRSWMYKVCPVDIANKEGTCSTSVTAVKRDLIPPTPVDTVSVNTVYPATPSAGPAKVVLTWRYFDLDTSGIGAAPTFYVTRAITTGLKMADWTPVATIPAPRRNSITTYTDMPPVGKTYWYRIQVRDNAGNWSNPSRPVKAGIFDRTPPAQPVIANDNKAPCLSALPPRLAVPTDVKQVVLYRSVGGGAWVLVKRFRPAIVKPNPYGVVLADTYVPNQTNEQVQYRVEYVDANGNASTPKIFCVRTGSPNGVATPRFDVDVSTTENRTSQVTVDFGSPATVISRSVVIARPSSTGVTSIVTTTLTSGAAQTYAFPIEMGESLRVGAFGSALTMTTDISSTLNSRWIRNVNNFLNLDTTPAPETFLDAPRNMAALGSMAVTWGAANAEYCTDRNPQPRKVCVFLDSKMYLKSEKPPLVALFRRVSPASLGLATADVPWLQVTPITSWTNKSSKWVIEDTTLIDPTRAYEYVAIAHSARSYEVIGYFDTTPLSAYTSRGVATVDVGTPVDTTGWVTRLPRGCFAGSSAEEVSASINNVDKLPKGLFTFDLTSGLPITMTNQLTLGNDWTFTVDNVYRPNGRGCVIPDPLTTDVQLYLGGTLRAGTNVISSKLIVVGTLQGDGTLRDSKFSTTFAPGAATSQVTSSVTNGLQIDLNDIAFIADGSGVVTNTVAMSVTVPAHLSLVVDTIDPLYSLNRASTMILYSDNVSGLYSSTGFHADVGSNKSFTLPASSGVEQIIVADEYAPWFYRVDGRVVIPHDASAVLLRNASAKSRFSYTQPAVSSKVPDNNSGFAGNRSDPTRDYTYTSTSLGANSAGMIGALQYTGPLNYVTSYPAGFAVATTGGVTMQVVGSRISAGATSLGTVQFDSYTQDSDTSFAKVGGGKALLIPSSYLPIDRSLTYTPGSTKTTTTLALPAGLTYGNDGIIVQSVKTTDTFRWPGFTLTPDATKLDLTFYAAPALPVGMSSYGTGLPKPVQSPWEQIDLGDAMHSDLDPGLNLNGTNEVSYGCYGTGIFNANFDAYLRLGGFSEHMILEGIGGAAIKNNTTGYDETLENFSAIFVDNVVVDPSDISATLVLPFPSLVEIPLQMTSFDSKGCPVGGTIGGGSGKDLNHAYWNFDQHATGFAYDAQNRTINRYAVQWLKTRGLPVNPANLITARAALPKMILQISGDVMPMAARDAAGNAAELPAVTEWLPDGDYGNVILNAGQMVYVSGMPFTPNDVLLNHYYGIILDPTSKPATLGFGPAVGPNIPTKLTDGSGNLTSDSLAACAAVLADRVGCGLQVLDGNTALSTFGETQKCAASSGVTCVNGAGTPAFAAPTPRIVVPEAELPSGAGTVGSAGDSSAAGDTLWNPVIAQWVWDNGSTPIDIPFPLIFIANRQGGVLAGMMVKQSVLPGPSELFKTDISLIVNGRLSGGVFTTDVGVYLGYSASQAAFRALATHRPNSDNTGYKSFAAWDDVKTDIKTWSKTFGYGTYDGTNNDSDPVDLAQDMWTGDHGVTWDTAGTQGSTAARNDYLDTFDYLEPKLVAAKGTESYVDTTQGITPLKQGTILSKTCTTLANGHGAASFQFNTLGELKMTELAFGSYMDIKRMGATACGTDAMLHVDRISLNLNGDGEIIILANHIQSDVLSTDVYFDVQLIVGTASGNRRLEGGIKVYNITLASVEFQNIGVVFGIGEYSSVSIGYFGFTGSGKFKNVGASAQFLIGTLPASSAVLRAQYPTLMTKLAADKGSSNVYSGLYISVSISVPIYNNGCTLEVIATGELRGWKLKLVTSGSTEVYGGYLSARVSAEVACLVSATGQLSLEISQVGSVMTFNGQAWVAGGVGDCEPSTWTSWGGRWWGDKWCAQAGAQVFVTYTDSPSDWDVTYDLDVESPW